MAKQTKAQRKAVLKYRKNKTHTISVLFTNTEYKKIYAYCKYINSPVATFVRKQIQAAIDSDPTFVYVPEEDDSK